MAFLAAAALVLGACSEQRPPSRDQAVPPPKSQAADPRSLTLPRDADVLIKGRTAGRPQQSGTADVDVQVSTLDGGDVRPSEGRDSRGAWRFPAFESRGSYPRAVMVARPVEGEDPLSPGLGRFAYGADIILDATSTGRKMDNGNNVVQRGLSGDPSLFKLEVDANMRPRCTVAGQADVLAVYALQPIEAGRWYRIRCELEPNVIRITVSEFLASGAVTTTGREERGDAGAVVYSDSEVPFSVGGKVAHDGSVNKSSTDQFNGEIDNANVIIR